MRMIDADALIKAINKCRCADCTEDGDIGCETCQWDSAICMIQDAPTVGGWISRKDKLPDKDGVYLTLTYDALGQAYPQIGMYRDGEWMWCAYVYYWMPIPKAPEAPEEVQK